MRQLLAFVCILMTLPLASETKLVIGISGGTGCGKTTLAEKLLETFSDRAVLISQDSYYKDNSHQSLEQKAKTNFDHPDSLDFALLREHILQLRSGLPVQVPVYDFCTHSRVDQKQLVMPADIVIIEGILLLAVPEIRELCDLKIFLDADHDIRLLRRMERDMRERARDFTSIRDQYLTTVKPMHEAFVEPSKQHADIIIPTVNNNETGLALIVSSLKKDLNFLDQMQTISKECKVATKKAAQPL